MVSYPYIFLMQKKFMSLSSPLYAWASDNFAPVPPELFQSLQDANHFYATAYGKDPLTLEAQAALLQLFPWMKQCLFTPNGTGANVLALRLGLKPWHSVLCSQIAHIDQQESGAAEEIVGCKLLRVATSARGILNLQAIEATFNAQVAFGSHATRPALLSLTQPTELGTIYSPEELRAIHHWCRKHEVLLHIDGARLWNAAAALQLPLKEICGECDLLSLGGTKLGAMMGEALLISPRVDLSGALYLQKQTLQLLSKQRYIAAQFLAFLKEKLWEQLAATGNARASALAEALSKIPSCEILFPPETNQLFIRIPPRNVSHLLERLWVWPWDEQCGILRLVASWCTTEEEVSLAANIIEEILSSP